MSGSLLNNAYTGNESYITNYNLTGSTITSSGGGTFQFETGYGITTNASNVSSVIGAPLAVRDANNLTFNVAQGTVPTGVDLLVSGAISNGTASATTVGAITKTGAGLMLIGSVSDTYTGSTTVANGSLLLSGGSLYSAGVVSVSGGAAFGGNGSAGSLTIASGGTLQGGYTSAGGSLSVASVNYLAGGGLYLSSLGSANTSSPVVTVAGALSTAGPITIGIGSLGTATTGVAYEIANYNSLSGGTGNFVLGTLPNRATGTFSFPSNQIDLTFSLIDFLHWSGSQSTAWDTTSANWTLNSTGATTAYIDNPGDSVVFDDNTSEGTVSIASAVHPATVTFSNTNTAYVLQGAGGHSPARPA